MNEKDEQILKEAVTDSMQLRSEFLTHRAMVRIQLFTMQASLFQTAAGICIALLGIGFGTKILTINMFSITSAVTLLLLVMYIFSYIRESIDAEDKHLVTQQQYVDKHVNQTLDSIQNSLKEGNADIFFDYAQNQSSIYNENKKRKQDLNYAGEIANFLLAVGLLSGLYSVFTFTNLLFCNVGVLILIFIVAVMASFFDWGIKITGMVSKILPQER